MTFARRTANRIRGIEFPVLRLETRVRQRRARPFIVMGVYAGALSVLVLVLYAYWLRRGSTSPADLSELGRILFMYVSLLQVALVCLIAPAYSAGAVSSERERCTFDLLAVTLLPTSAIAMEKLAAAVLEIVLLLAASLPVFAVAFMFGSVSPMEIAQVYAILLATGCFLGALGILCSCIFGAVRTSVFASYLTMVALLMGIPVGLVALEAFTGSQVGLAVRLTDLLVYQAGPVSFLAFGVICGALSLVTGGALSLVTARRYSRVVLFGLCYLTAVLTLIGTGQISSALSATSVSLPDMFTVANPLRAVSEITEPYADASEVLRLVATSLGIMVSHVYLCQWLSIRKLDVLRRS